MKVNFLILIGCLNYTLSNAAIAADTQQWQPVKTDTRSDNEIMSVAQSEFLIGKWEGLGRAAESIYGTMEISKTDIAWRDCKTKYEIVDKSIGDSYPDIFRSPNGAVPFKRYITFKLKLDSVECLSKNKEFLQFTISADMPSDGIVMELNKENKQKSRMSFFKR